MKSARLAMILALLCGTRAFAAGGAGGGGGMPGGPKGPTGAPTPITGPTGQSSRPLTASGAASHSGAGSEDPLHPESDEDFAARHRAMENWTTFFEAVQPGFLAIGAARELPLGFRLAASSGMFLVTPTFATELQLPALHAGPVRLYAAGAATWMYASKISATGPSGHAWGAGPKLGIEWRLPMKATAAHGWHLGADAGLLYGNWSPIFGPAHRKSLPTFTPLRIGYYW